MRIFFRLSVLLATIMVAASGWAQKPAAQPSSTVCHDDGTVTFYYKNDQAKNVMVDVQFAGRKAMKRNKKTGLWSVTLGPAAPDMYPYCFIVDGVSVMDPENPQYFPNEGFKNSLLEIPAKTGALAHDIKDVPHGRVEYVHYYSQSLGATNNAIVILPPNYAQDQQKKYPVFYLISGTTDTDEVYYKVGRVNYILDNLLADKAAKEMIVVLPYGNPHKLKPMQAQGNGMPQTRFGGDVFSKDLINDLMPYVEKNYRTINDRDHRAIGGFSRGGNQALFNGLSNLDKFSYLCSYSSFTSMDIPQVYDNAGDTNSKIHLFWLGVGTDDFLYGNARDYMEFLDKKGIRSVKVFTHDKFGHTWMNAKYFLSKTLPLLFNKEASEAAMQAGQPAPAVTGKEQQFTPGVMARLFPKPIISPDYSDKTVTFRFKAPDAKTVALEGELMPQSLPMTKDADGVWSVTLTDHLMDVFKYCFVVDGMRVADPSNMYLSPDRGFKYSIADNPASPYNFMSQGDIQHGHVTYDLARQEATYVSAMPQDPSMPVYVRLVPGNGDTVESWFKVGGADAVADRLVAEGKSRPCVLMTGQLQGDEAKGITVHTLRAADYATWQQRRQALADLLQRLGKEQEPFLNTNLPYEERVEKLLALLTPEEKVGLMMNKSVSVDRLGIPSYNWWNEACHGVRQGGYTVYPQPIGMAAAFNAQLVYDVFSQVSDEARANWNRSDHNIFHVPMGVTYYPGNPELTYWCPNVNIFRDPRWGRGQETCGEDPYLNAVLGVQTVLGMQGDPTPSPSGSGSYFKTHACAKHYAVHSGPEPLRHSMNVEPTNRDLWETYLPAFKALVKKGNVREVMCAYQRFEGKPCCTSDRLLIDILRNKWGYDGIVLTDCDAINNFYNKGQHETHKDPLSASVDAVLNGTDLECGKVFMSLTEGLKKGYIKESDLDQHLRKTLLGRFELGMFDPADMLPWSNITSADISSEEHDALATQAARESMVLLENKGVLPLSKSLKTIAVLGPNADDAAMLNGNYGGTPTEEHTHSLLDGIKAAVPGAKVIYHKACELNDDYTTVHHLGDFNDGKGVLVEFWNDREQKGTPVKSAYYDKLDFSTFGAWGFAEGVNNDNLAVRISGKYKAAFTGEMKYTLMTDNGYTLKVNGQVVEEAKPAARGFFRRQVEYKSFNVKAGETYDVEIIYRRGFGQFAMLRGDICERILVDFSPLAEEVKAADAIIIIGGISAQMEGEGGDKQDIELPRVQQRLLQAVHATGRPVVFVNCSGSAIAFGSVEGQYDALLQAWYAGQGGAKALAEVLFGDYNPGGKLPVTFYRSTSDLPDFLDYSMKNRTYRYFTGKPQYAFGYGLSYTTFRLGKGKLSDRSVARSFPNGKTVTLTVPVTNTGKREGSETVQVYVKALDDAGAPLKALKGFQKLTLKPGQTATATITLDAEAFEYYDESIDELSVRPGRYQILYGTSSLDKDLQRLDFVVK